MVRKVMADIEAKGVDFSEHRLRHRMDELMAEAKKQIMAGAPQLDLEITSDPIEAVRGVDAVILAVKHDPIAKLGVEGTAALLAPGGLIYDLKGILPRDVSHARL